MGTVDSVQEVAKFSPGTFTDLIVVPLLIGLLIFKEVSTSVPTPRARLIGRILDVALVPLLVIYISLVATRLLRNV